MTRRAPDRVRAGRFEGPWSAALLRALCMGLFSLALAGCSSLPFFGDKKAADGEPSDLTTRRWQRFGISGAKLIWGGEAVAVQHDGRANPNQLILTPRTHRAIAGLRETLVAAHRERFGSDADADLAIGLQLTHSGRYARPADKARPEPLAAYHHPQLDRRFPAGVRLLTDDDLDRLALPQARVATGFFPNAVLLDFDNLIRVSVGNQIAPGALLVDGCIYVDDLRLVVEIENV